MNAKELRAAAEMIAGICDIPNIVDNIQRWYAISPPAQKVAAHILATVRGDDDDEMSWDEAARQESHRTFFHVEAGSSVWRAYIDGKRCISEFTTKGHFRKLCELLGVTLKEPS